MNEEVIIRLSSFIGALTLFSVWEILAPRRNLTASKIVRWLNNLALVMFNNFTVRLLFPTAAMGVAVFVNQQQWGLLNLVSQWIGIPSWLHVLIAVVLLDLAIYLQHFVFHRVPWLWRLHRMHHADTDIDVTTALRFHPLEIILSLLIKFAVIILIGAPALAVLLFEIVLNVGAMFNHSNIRMPLLIDRYLRQFIVTPDMHRVHHSVLNSEMHCNFGFNLAIWDRLFATYRAQPQAGHIDMTIGLPTFRQTHFLTLPWLFAIPFLNPTVSDEVNHADTKL